MRTPAHSIALNYIKQVSVSTLNEYKESAGLSQNLQKHTAGKLYEAGKITEDPNGWNPWAIIHAIAFMVRVTKQ